MADRPRTEFSADGDLMSESYALALDAADPLASFRERFYVPADKMDRFAAFYTYDKDRKLVPHPSADFSAPPALPSGGGGLVSTASDYMRFCQMLLNGGELDGKRILGRKLVELMTADQLDGLDFNPGQGFGLGFYVVEDVGARGLPGSEGEFGWGGAYHSVYWVDPLERLVVVHLTQLIPAGEVDDMGKVRALVYQAIVD